MRLKKFLLSAALGGLALLGANSAQANSIIITATNALNTMSFPPDLVTPPQLVPPLVGGNYDYYYRVSITPNNQWNAGDFASIFDFSGLVAGSYTFTPTTWAASFGGTFTTSTPGLTSGINVDMGAMTLVATQDNAAVQNLVVTYNGPTTITSLNANLAGGIFDGSGYILGFIKASSTLFTPRIDGYVGQDHVTPTQESENGAQTLVPGLPGGGELPLPLPTAAWGGMALIGLLGTKRLRRGKQA